MVAIRQNTIGKNKPTHLVAHLHFCQHTNQTEKCKRATKPTHQQDTKNDTTERTTTDNSGLAKCGVQWLIER